MKRKENKDGMYESWRKSFEQRPCIRELLAELADKGVIVANLEINLWQGQTPERLDVRGELNRASAALSAAQGHLEDAEKLLTSLSFHPEVQSQLAALKPVCAWIKEQRKHLKKSWAHTTFQTTDILIASMTRDLTASGIRNFDEVIAALLTAANIPGGERDKYANAWVWSAEVVNKRRDRLKANPLAAVYFGETFGWRINPAEFVQKHPDMFTAKASTLLGGLSDPAAVGTRTPQK